MRTKSNKFQKLFASCRENSGMTYRELGATIGIKHSALAAMQTGNRSVGEQSARRLACIFGLAGKQQEEFILAAINTSKERVLDAVKDFPAEVLNLLALVLLSRGIKPTHIVGCEIDPVEPESLTLSLKGGRTAHLHVSGAESLEKRLHHG